MTMKGLFLLIFSLLSIGLCRSQVGINTQTSQGVFNIDPRGDTSGSSGTSDDIIVTSDGKMGIGTLSPSARLHIDKGSSASFLRIEDTSEGANKYLVSDENGAGSWIPAIDLYGKVYRMTSPSQVQITYPYNVVSPIRFNLIKSDSGTLTNNGDNGFIRIDADGNYIFTFRWWGAVSTASTPVAPYYFLSTRAYLRLYKVVSGVVSGSPLDEVLIYCPVSGKAATGRNSFVTSLFAEGLKKDELYAITITPDDGIDNSWILGLGLNSATGQFDNVVFFPSVMVYNI